MATLHGTFKFVHLVPIARMITITPSPQTSTRMTVIETRILSLTMMMIAPTLRVHPHRIATVALTAMVTAGLILVMPSPMKVANGPTKTKMDSETIQTASMAINVPLLGVTHSKIDMDAQIGTMTAGRILTTGANGARCGPRRMVPMHFGRTLLNGPTTTSMDTAITGPIQNGMTPMKKWVWVNS